MYSLYAYTRHQGTNGAVLYYLCCRGGAAPLSLRREESCACVSFLCSHLARGPSHIQLPCNEALIFVRIWVKVGFDVGTAFPNSEFDGCF